MAYAEVGKLTPAQALGDRREARRRPQGRAARSITSSRAYTSRMSTTATRLEPGMTFVGPAIVDMPGTTVVVHPGNRGPPQTSTGICIDPSGWCSGRSLCVSRPPQFDPITLEIIQTSLQATADEMFAADAPDGNERDHLRGARHGHRHHRCRGQLASKRCGHSCLRRRARQGRTAGAGDQPSRTRLRRATSSPPTIPTTAASRTSMTWCWPCRCSPIKSLVAWTANIAHWNDVGGMVPEHLHRRSAEIYQEGLRLPAVKLVDAREPHQIGDALSWR